MKFSAKSVFFLTAVFLVLCFAGCGSSPQLAAVEEVFTGPFEVKGNFIFFPEPVEGSATATPTRTPAEQYQGTAITANMLSNASFAVNGKSGVPVGNWNSSNWDGKTNFIAASPGENPPAPKSLYLPPGAEKVNYDVMQRVPVEIGEWYYLSIWYYAKGGKGNGCLVYIDLLGKDSAGFGTAHSRIFFNSSGQGGSGFIKQQDEWMQLSTIVQIPTEISGFTDTPYMNLRFRQNHANAPAMYFTKAQIHKLSADSVKNAE